MVAWTNNAVNHYWQTTMGLTAEAKDWLTTVQGILNPGHFLEMDDDTILQINRQTNRMRYGPAPNEGGNLVQLMPIILPAAFWSKLKKSVQAAKHYNWIDVPITPGIMALEPHVNELSMVLNIQEEKRSSGLTLAPKCGKQITFLEYLSLLEVWLADNVSSHPSKAPLAYLARDNAAVPDAAVLVHNQVYTAEGGSILGDLTLRLTHNNAAFNEDSKRLLSALVNGLSNTEYASTLEPFKPTWDGRGALIRLKAQFAGDQMWLDLKNSSENTLARSWNGSNPSITFATWANTRRQAHTKLVQCSSHINYQVMTEPTKVESMLKHVSECKDPNFLAGVASVKQSSDPDTGLSTDFERAVACLTKFCPVADSAMKSHKRRKTTANIGSMTAANGQGNGLKCGIGKSGVHLRWYTKEEYSQLTNPQKDELNAHRDDLRAKGKQHELPGLPENMKKKGKKPNNKKQEGKKQKKQKTSSSKAPAVYDRDALISGLLAKAATESGKEKEATLSCISSMIGTDVVAETPTSTPPAFLQRIVQN